MIFYNYKVNTKLGISNVKKSDPGEGLLMSTRFLFGVMISLKIDYGKLYNSVIVLKITESFTLKELIVWY